METDLVGPGHEETEMACRIMTDHWTMPVGRPDVRHRPNKEEGEIFA